MSHPSPVPALSLSSVKRSPSNTTPPPVIGARLHSAEHYSTSGSNKTSREISPVPNYRNNDRLYFEGRDRELQKQERLIAMRLEKLAREERREQCTFSPMISPYARSLRRPRSLSPENRALGEVLRRKEVIAVRRREVALNELRGCTFQPLTLRAATLSPDAVIRRHALHRELHADHEIRQHFREMAPKLAGTMEDQVIHPKNTPRLPEEEVQNIVQRLLTVQPGSAANDLEEEHLQNPKPKMSHVSHVLAAKRRATLQEPADVVERLLVRPVHSGPVWVEDAAKSSKTTRSSSPAANDEENVRNKNLQQLFQKLADASPLPPSAAHGAVPVVGLAQAANTILSDEEGHDVIGILGRSQKREMTCDAFVAAVNADFRKSGPKSFAYHRKAAHPPPGEVAPFRPTISQKSREMVPDRHRDEMSGVPLNLLKTKKHPTTPSEEEDAKFRENYPFAPKTTPYDGPAPPPPGWVAPQPRRSSRTSPQPEQEPPTEPNVASTGPALQEPAQQQRSHRPTRSKVKQIAATYEELHQRRDGTKTQ